MKKKFLVIFVSLLLCVGVYLNRSYAHIYDKITIMGLPASNSKQIYTIGDTKSSNKNLVYVALGDSLTAGVGVDSYEQSYPYLFAEKIAQKNIQVTIYPYAIPGAKTKDVQEIESYFSEERLTS